ncbi:NADPH-dependent FMN reductase [uncultured Sporomusa sp.]|uniref:NADPH-dependent FMN reductase n=1 Tax=uncultured Sporomusa sp. TaxID=307249 RepID=A0A212LNM4_9FIRM|nr:flavodoxin family protein [uncultured Sporomusa sp.]SCM79143.1 NADPH-dependent FMN reductase [uncultured Sporomusa sp.]
MIKNVLVITGSPRKNGNSELMANAFIKGALEKGHQVTAFDAATKTISGCRACDTCWSTGRACSFYDGFTELEPLLEQADAIVFVSPLYWFSLSAQIKAAIDKMYAYTMECCKTPLKIKESMLLTCGADEGMEVFSGIIGTYKEIANYLKWQDSGIIAIPNVKDKGDILNTDALQRAEQLGKTL